MSKLKIRKHPLNKKWEISIIELKNDKKRKYKVTRRIPELSVSEIKMFNSKKRAKNQFNKWLK